MAAPIVWGLFAAANLIGGALLRQPEVNRLKAQVATLQAEIVRLRGIIDEQQRQIQELKLRYDTLNFLRVFEKQRLATSIKEQIFQVCSFKEYISLAMRKAKGEKLPDGLQRFLHSYEMLTTGNDDKVTDEDFDFMIDFIEAKYAGSIECLSAPSIEAELKNLEQYN